MVNTNKKDRKKSLKRPSRNVMQTTKYLKTRSSNTSWEIKGQDKAYKPTLRKNNLCLNEEIANIDDPDKNLLNKRLEVISQCHYRNTF